MASTPSASALSAVLRCQGNMLARKRANKTRPAASVYALGMKSSSGRSYFRALLGYLFHWEKLEIPGVLSVSTQFKTRFLRQSAEAKDQLLKNALVSKNLSNAKLKSDCYGIAFQSEQQNRILPQSNRVLRVADAHLSKIISDYPRTFCVCIVCKSTLNPNETDSLFPVGLLSLLKKRLMCLTAAVSDIVRTKLGIDRTNQIDPDCDKLSGCAQYGTEDHKEPESKTRQGKSSEPEE